MAAKFVILAFLVAAAHGSGLNSGDYSSFSYGVSDPHTGDVKSQQENHHDNVVRQYSLLESDGSHHTVDAAPLAHGYASYATPLALAAQAVSPSTAQAASYSNSVSHIAPQAHGDYAAPSASYAGSLGYDSHATPIAQAFSYSTFETHVTPQARAYVAPQSHGYSGNLGYESHGAPLAQAVSYSNFEAHVTPQVRANAAPQVHDYSGNIGYGYHAAPAQAISYSNSVSYGGSQAHHSAPLSLRYASNPDSSSHGDHSNGHGWA